MKVLVDTSVWVDFFNGHPSQEAGALADLIESDADIATCGVIAAEFLQGIRSQAMVERLERHFLDLTWLTPHGPQTYLAAANLYRTLRRQCVTVRSTIDCLIACLAGEWDYLLLARDRDFTHILASSASPAKPFGEAD